MTVSNPLCGWSGNPPGNLTIKLSNIKNGFKFGIWLFPIDIYIINIPITLITDAPLPSATIAGENILTILLDIFNYFIEKSENMNQR